MKIEITIECENSAFCDEDGEFDPGPELCRILKKLIRDELVLENGGALLDVNGNHVGGVAWKD